MNDLSTNEKSSLVAAINEIAAGSGGSSDLPIVVSDTLPEDDYIPDRGEIRSHKIHPHPHRLVKLIYIHLTGNMVLQ